MKIKSFIIRVAIPSDEDKLNISPADIAELFRDHMDDIDAGNCAVEVEDGKEIENR